jgi:uncharacterized protein YukE
MKGNIDMAVNPNAIFGQIDGILGNASGFQQVTDSQATIVQTLGQVIEDLAPSFQGQQGTALQACGEQLKQAGTNIQMAFENQSHMMANNANLLANQDAHNAGIINQVLNLT